MESNKVDILNYVKIERSAPPEYPDEAIFSNLYYTSFSYALRAINGYIANGRSVKQYQEANEWIIEKSNKALDINVINFDRVVGLLCNGRASCDAFFYNFDHQDGEFHFISEFKNAGKQDLLNLLKSEGEDGIYRKVKDSIENIRNSFLFGGNQEADDIIRNMHFFIVYNGKNTAATSVKPKICSKMCVSRNANGKQNRATRTQQYEYSHKDENEIYRHFGDKIKQLNMRPCTEETFPGKAIPRLKKSECGSEKVRYFTIFSAQDFGELISSDFFDHWNWGPYLPDNDDITENT